MLQIYWMLALNALKFVLEIVIEFLLSILINYWSVVIVNYYTFLYKQLGSALKVTYIFKVFEAQSCLMVA